MRVAAVDCGTNTIRLLVTDLDPESGGQTDVARETRYVRLGQGVDRTGALASDAVARTLAAAADYAERLRSLDAERVRCGATSAVRDAANADGFLADMADRLGVRPVVLAGLEEARLSWLGAMRGLVGSASGDPSPGLPPKQLVVDIGGGSTELISGVGDHMESAVSLDVGSVRLTERHLASDPPTGPQVVAARADVDAALDRAGLDLSAVGTVVGVAGSITTIAAHVLGLPAYDSSRIHHARLGIDDVVASCDTLLATRVEDRRAMPFMPTGRADVIGGGAVVLERLLNRLAPTLRLDRLVVSEHDILDGLAWSAVES